jgi:hypothetical protein
MQQREPDAAAGAIDAREGRARAQHPVDLTQQPSWALAEGTWCSIVKQTTALNAPSESGMAVPSRWLTRRG